MVNGLALTSTCPWLSVTRTRAVLVAGASFGIRNGVENTSFTLPR